jgi:outer membrane protein|uniref:OmpH family outer membrane protein n=1 Tax=Candidatus Pelagibacter sp. TaxID=2024849 RepID=UPI004049D90F|tara:strand:- start:4584 stop:5102 length:519 start_codon:yes stop_codon:yes gene_type:complete
MKKVVIIFFIYFFQINFVIANTSIAFIDMDKVISLSKPGSSIMSQLNSLSSQNSKKFESEAKKIKEQETKLISQKNILSEVDFQSNINKLKLEIKNYNDNRDKINNDFNKLRIDSTNKLLKLINPILVSYSNDKSISLILKKRDLVIGKTELDITDEIILIINKDINQFKIQ